jgi:hypothetical protein
MLNKYTLQKYAQTVLGFSNKRANVGRGPLLFFYEEGKQNRNRNQKESEGFLSP